MPLILRPPWVCVFLGLAFRCLALRLQPASSGMAVSRTPFSADGSAILTFTGTYAPRSGSLWLSDVSHHHLALGIVALLLSHMLSVAVLLLREDASVPGLTYRLA